MVHRCPHPGRLRGAPAPGTPDSDVAVGSGCGAVDASGSLRLRHCPRLRLLPAARGRRAGVAALFLRRARGEIPFFRRVLAVARTPAGRAAILAALTDDPVVSGRFRAAS